VPEAGAKGVEAMNDDLAAARSLLMIFLVGFIVIGLLRQCAS
jgi:hypothetical protein